MKVRIFIVAVILGLLLVFGAGSVGAQDSGIKVKLDGRALTFDQPPVEIDGHTMVPLRRIFEELGMTVDWQEDTQTIDAKGQGVAIHLKVGDTNALVNSDARELDQPPVIEGYRVLVPLRFLSEALGSGGLGICF